MQIFTARIEKLEEQINQLKRLNQSLADRCLAQSEALAKAAERTAPQPTPLPVVDEADKVCENCRNWHRHQDDRLGVGQCRRNPPQFVLPHRDWDGTAASYLYQCSEWPITADYDWCVTGWEPKPGA